MLINFGWAGAIFHILGSTTYLHTPPYASPLLALSLQFSVTTQEGRLSDPGLLPLHLW